MCSENKGADQLRGNREADLRLCLRICKNPVFSRRGSHLDNAKPRLVVQSMIMKRGQLVLYILTSQPNAPYFLLAKVITFV